MNLRRDRVTLLTLHSVEDSERGTLCVAEHDKHIPFEMKRIFYLYDLPEGIMRGQHAHRHQDQFLICLQGSVEILAIDKHRQHHSFTLSRPNVGLYFPAMTWVSFKTLTINTLCLVISSGVYDESEYIRNFANFKALI